MRTLATFLLLLCCVVTLTTPTALAARMLSVSTPAEMAAHCQTDVDHPDGRLADPVKSADPTKTDTGFCAECSDCQLCACQCQISLLAPKAPQAASHTDSQPKAALERRFGTTASPELKPPRK